MTPSHSPTEVDARALGAHARIVCLSTDVGASGSLQALVAALVPEARVESADTSILRGVPNADCAIVSVGTMYSLAASLVQELRARGFAGAIVLVADSDVALKHEEIERYGVDAHLTYAALPTALFEVLSAIMARRARSLASPQGEAILAALQRTQSLLAAGTIASGLQHRLNNPLAALLAEAQLLELEPLDAEHAGSVRRMVHLCRRIIEVSRSIEGIVSTGGGAAGALADGEESVVDGKLTPTTNPRARMLPEPRVNGL